MLLMLCEYRVYMRRVRYAYELLLAFCIWSACLLCMYIYTDTMRALVCNVFACACISVYTFDAHTHTHTYIYDWMVTNHMATVHLLIRNGFHTTMMFIPDLACALA